MRKWAGLGARNWGSRKRNRIKKWRVGSEQRMWGWGAGKRSGRPTPFGGIASGFSQEDSGSDVLPFHADVRPLTLSLSSNLTCPHCAMFSCIGPALWLMCNFQEAAVRSEEQLTLTQDLNWLTAFSTNHLGPPYAYYIPGTGLKSRPFPLSSGNAMTNAWGPQGTRTPH